MKILTVCLAGTVRSVALKNQCLEKGHDAIAASAIKNSPETLRHLCRWADLVLVVEPQNLGGRDVPWLESWSQSVIWNDEFAFKRVVCNIGPDVWGTPINPQLWHVCDVVVRDLLKAVEASR